MPARISAVLFALLLTLSCSLTNRESLSPGEVIPASSSQQTGAENPARHAVAIVVNGRGEILLSFCERPQGWNIPFGDSTPSAGENAMTWKQTENVLNVSKVNFLMLPDVLSAWFNVMTTSNWHGEEGREWARVEWHLLNQHDLDQLWALRGEQGPSELFALKWAAAAARRNAGESPLEAATRVAQAKLGVPAEQLREEHYWYNPANATAYLRLRYTGNSNDQFVFVDSDRKKMRLFRSNEAWFSPNHAAARLVAAYLHVIEGVPSDQTLWLFKRK